ncbi:hypothetical protein BLNAU_13523 [Blattamonas nauphoetae]|uniref:Transmembrane protein n=1 Tax=Blattamonas nauphoetae TaxID=2049346 RepID=A0ABQ9XGB2_9EUKA|nr:hypothetical protein BLNAU_13523 [Blattamonas nauphoetae]
MFGFSPPSFCRVAFASSISFHGTSPVQISHRTNPRLNTNADSPSIFSPFQRPISGALHRRPSAAFLVAAESPSPKKDFSHSWFCFCSRSCFCVSSWFFTSVSSLPSSIGANRSRTDELFTNTQCGEKRVTSSEVLCSFQTRSRVFATRRDIVRLSIARCFSGRCRISNSVSTFVQSTTPTSPLSPNTSTNCGVSIGSEIDVGLGWFGLGFTVCWILIRWSSLFSGIVSSIFCSSSSRASSSLSISFIFTVALFLIAFFPRRRQQINTTIIERRRTTQREITRGSHHFMFSFTDSERRCEMEDWI